MKAKFSFEYVLQCNPEDAMAMTALAITEICLGNRGKAIQFFQKSFELDNQNPLTMKYLAE